MIKILFTIYLIILLFVTKSTFAQMFGGGTGDGYDAASFLQPPISFSATTTSSSIISITWQLNTNSDYVIIAFNTTNSFGTPINGMLYSEGETIPDGGTVIYKGDAAAFNHEARTHNTTYYYKIWSYDKASNSYSNTGLTSNATTLTVDDPVNFSASENGSSKISLSWALNNNSEEVIVAYNTTENFGTPTNGTTYSNGINLSGGGTIIYKGSLTAYEHNSLKQNTPYYYKIWSYDINKSYSGGITSNATTTVVAPASSLMAEFKSGNNITLTWASNSSNDDVIIVYNKTNTLSSLIDETEYNVGDTLSSDGIVIYKGTNTTFEHDTLDANTTYYYTLWSKNIVNNYSTSVTANEKTRVKIPKSFNATTTGLQQILLTWALNDSSNNVMAVYNTSNNFGTPVHGSSYSAGATISGGGTVLYNGNKAYYLDYNLNTETTYYYKVWSVDGDNNYSDGLSDNSTTYSSTFLAMYKGGNSDGYSSSSLIEAALPVELTMFTAALTNSTTIELNWETATEVNNYGFEVLRQLSVVSDQLSENPSADGWETIGFVEGHGNSNSPKTYQFIDASALLSINSSAIDSIEYRLKQIDTDGTFEYYNQTAKVGGVITAIEEESVPTVYSLEQNYPNPFNPTTKINYAIPQLNQAIMGTCRGVSVRLVIYDMLGRQIAVLVNKQQSPGRYTVEWNASNLSSGTYIYRITAGEFIDTKKLLLLK